MFRWNCPLEKGKEEKVGETSHSSDRRLNHGNLVSWGKDLL